MDCRLLLEHISPFIIILNPKHNTAEQWDGLQVALTLMRVVTDWTSYGLD